jgi:hypothetical protein
MRAGRSADWVKLAITISYYHRATRCRPMVIRFQFCNKKLVQPDSSEPIGPDTQVNLFFY